MCSPSVAGMKRSSTSYRTLKIGTVNAAAMNVNAASHHQSRKPVPKKSCAKTSDSPLMTPEDTTFVLMGCRSTASIQAYAGRFSHPYQTARPDYLDEVAAGDLSAS